MRILVTGARGQVGRELIERGASTDLKKFAFAHDQLDITDESAVRDAIQRKAPDVVINAAAYTAVDQVEDDPATAFTVNEHGPRYLATACTRAGIPLIHLSTDYVFDGKQDRPYQEDDEAAPLSIYGQSKWQGEQAVRQSLPQHIILSTSCVFSANGHNFVKIILRLAHERSELRVVVDQKTCPTAATDIADVILVLLRRITTDQPIPWGTYHYCGVPPISWHAFAGEIVDIARGYGRSTAHQIVPITTAQYPARAQRPANSVLDCSKIQDVFNLSPRPWKDSLVAVIEALCA